MATPRIKARNLHEKAMPEDAEYRREYEALEEEFSLIAAMLDARQKAGLTQAQVAERMGIKQPLVAKIEGCRSNVSIDTLKRYAHATGCEIKVEFIQANPYAKQQPKIVTQPCCPFPYIKRSTDKLKGIATHQGLYR